MALNSADDSAFAAALAAARNEPENDAHWELAEQLAEVLHRVDDVAAAYREALGQNLSPELAGSLGRRAATFHETWLADDNASLTQVLLRVLAVLPDAEWAFMKLTATYTLAERWQDLLALYDQTLVAPIGEARRVQVLEEAAHLARDFAGQADRAVDYMHQLLGLRPNDERLEASLERLLERQERWSDLIALWKRRIELQGREATPGLQARIAETALDRLHAADAALDEVRTLLSDSPEDRDGCALLERIIVLPSASPGVRSGALELLRTTYEDARRPEEVIRVLNVALPLADTATAIALHREIGERLVGIDRAVQAMDHYVDVLRLDPNLVEDQRRLRHLSENTGEFLTYVRGLLAAAEVATDKVRRVVLLTEAGDVQHDTLHDTAAAIDLYGQVLAIAETPEDTARRVARRLDNMLEETGRSSERLSVLEQLGALETGFVQSEALGDAARLALTLGEPERALSNWRARLGLNGDDHEALAAAIELTEQLNHWSELAGRLRQRANGPVAPHQRRADLTRVAGIEAEQLSDPAAATTTWQAIQSEFGDSDEGVEALAALLARQERWAELAELLSSATGRGSEQIADLSTRLGDVYRAQLGKAAQSVACYGAALTADPAHAGAREGLLATLDDAEARPAAVALLGKLYRGREEWPELAKIVESRLEVTADPLGKADILRETAEIQEKRLGDLGAALGLLRRTFAITPTDRELERDVVRLAETTSDWSTLIDAYRDGIVSLGDGNRRRTAELRMSEGHVLEDRLGDHAMALEAYGAVLSLDARHAEAVRGVLRTGSQVGRWDAVAEALVNATVADGEVDAARIAQVEADAAAHGGWDALTLAVEAATAGADGLTPVARAYLDGRVAVWHRDHRGDEAAARAALERALVSEPGHLERLLQLTELQRRNPDASLIDTLLALDGARVDNFDELYEASELALGLDGDTPRTREILVRLQNRAAALWSRGLKTTGQKSAEECVGWAVQQLSRLHEQSGERREAADLLAKNAALPFAAATSQAMRSKAAGIYGSLGDRTNAITLYRSVVDENPDDLATVGALGDMLEQEERYPELLTIRHHELARTEDPARKLDLRLDVSRVVGIVEERGGRISALRRNLDEQPGHDPSIAALTEVLSAKASPDELAEFLAGHAERLEAGGDRERAVRLWSQHAELSERLGNVPRAISSHRRVVSLESGNIASLDAIARLFIGRGESADAVPWLQQRLERTPAGSERAVIVLQLADALLAAGKTDRATQVLARSVAEDPKEPRTREILLRLYREAQAWEPLAALLQSAAHQIEDRAQLLGYFYEAAAIFRDRLGASDRAIPVLEQLRALVPDDVGVLRSLADALWSAQRFAEARAILEKMLADFGRRRSPDRAHVHTKLAALARAEGNRVEALAQLELATSMDITNQAALHMLAELSQEDGDLARAERTYRALLLAARRRPIAADDEAAFGISEALYELSRLAARRNQDGPAAELLEQAIQAALADDREARKLQRTLRTRGDAPLLIRVLRSRLSYGPEGEAKAGLLGDLADALDATGKGDESLGLRLQALQDAPNSDALHKAASEQAARQGNSQRYIDTVQALVDKARRRSDAPQAADLLIRVAEIVEREFGDHDKAAEIYGRIEALEHRVVEAWMGLARIAAARGDSTRQVELLERISSAPSDAMSPETRARASFGLAEIHLAAPESRDSGVAAMRRALADDPRYEIAEPILRRTLATAPDHPELLALYEEVLRNIGDEAALLAFLERRANSQDGAPATAREAAELAQKAGDGARAESLMGRTLELARQHTGADEHAIWALLSLAARRRDAGDVGEAIAYLRDASALAEPAQTFDLGLELAGLAAAQPDKLSLAAEIYEDLLTQDPANRKVWAPLREVYKQIGDQDRLQGLVESTLGAIDDVKERNSMRLELVHNLLATMARETEAVRLLKDILAEEPGHKEAERLLAEVFERTGYDTELVELLTQQLLSAQESKEAEAVVAAALRLGDLHRRTQPDEAKAVYRTALDFAPDNRELIEALLSLLDNDHDPRERAEITERLLAVESGEQAVKRTLSLADQWDKLGDHDGVARVLERGYKAAPESDELRGRLEQWYRAREDWSALATLLVESADRAIEPADAVRLLREASTLYTEKLAEAAKAAEVLRKACSVDPVNMVLLRELVARLSETGEHQAAIDELTQALDWQPLDQRTLVEFLRRRAELSMIVGAEDKAAADLERAYEVVGAELIPDLIDGLERWRSAATRRSDRDGERAATIRLVEILGKEGAADQARHTLAAWVAREPGDTQALRMLMAMDTAAGSWESVIESCTRLVAAETGEAQISAVLTLVEACEKVGRPNDAKAGLEIAYNAQPGNEAVRDRLKAIFEEEENYQALARILIDEASKVEDENARFLMLRQAGELMLDDDPAAAAVALKQALSLKPSDQAVNLLLVEAYTASKQQDEADAILDTAIESMKGRRSPELCVLQYRKAAVAGAVGNHEQQLHWLKEAHNTDRNNGDVAVELAALAEKLEDYDLAIRVLRSIALMEAAPMSRAVAYLRQGYIAERRGDRQKAVLWGRKALMEDPNCTEATDFLKQIGEL